MNKLKTAKVISDITNPPILCIPLFLIMCIVLSFENGEFNMSKFIVLELISLVFSSILPMAIILGWAKKIGTDKDISNRWIKQFFDNPSFVLCSEYLHCNDNNIQMENQRSHNRIKRACWCIDIALRTIRCNIWNIISDTYLVKGSFKKAYPGTGNLRCGSRIFPNHI